MGISTDQNRRSSNFCRQIGSAICHLNVAFARAAEIHTEVAKVRKRVKKEISKLSRPIGFQVHSISYNLQKPWRPL